ETRAVDLDPDTIGTTKCGVMIEDSEQMAEDMIRWADLILCTGSTVVNGTLVTILDMAEKAGTELVFFGTSIAGMAALKGLNHFCPKSK
ncbi:MAG: DUF364 domain-containing protein, partial [Oscillospiraceae bacterium]|nr:DUF364 domain-containing protein [Oscillospiraceae bacterium]